jgi:hypothetical protein
MPNKLLLGGGELPGAAEIPLNVGNQIDASPIRDRSAVYVLER